MSAAARTEPSWLDARLPCWRKPQPQAGLFVVVDPAADLWWAEQTLAGDDTELLVWISTSVQPERTGLQVAQRHGVRAVSLAPARHDLRRLRTALQLAYRLRNAPG